MRRIGCTAPEEARGEQNVLDKEKRRPDSQWKRIASEKERLYNEHMWQKLASKKNFIMILIRLAMIRQQIRLYVFQARVAKLCRVGHVVQPAGFVVQQEEYAVF